MQQGIENLRGLTLRIAKILLILILACRTVWAGLDCDGVDDKVSNSTRIFTAASARTISLWANIDNPQPGSFRGRFISERSNTGWFLGTGTNRDIQFFSSGSTNLSHITNTGAYSATTWTHVLVTWDGSTTAANAKIYVNGTEASYATTTNGVSLTSADSAGTRLCDEASALEVSADLDGRLDEVAVWDVVLTAQEIAQLASSRVKGIPLQIQPSSLKRYWSTDDSGDGVSLDGVVLKDSSSNLVSITGDNGANNTGMTAVAEAVLSYA